MARSQKINKIKFYSINRDVKEAKLKGRNDTALIAQKQHVSVETVRAVRVSKTWPAFVTRKQLKAVSEARRKADAFEKAQQVGGAVATKTVVGKSLRAPKSPEEQLAIGLKELVENPVQYVTVKQFTDAIDSLNGKIKQDRIRADRHKEQIEENQKNIKAHAGILSRIQQLKPRWFRQG